MPAITESPPARMGPSAAIMRDNLRDMAQRWLRAPRGRWAIAVHIAKLTTARLQSYHLRILRALLDDAAERHQGGVFFRASGDAIMLIEPGLDGADAAPLLAGTLTALYADYISSAGAFCTVWPLESGGADFYAYLDQSQPAPPPEPPAMPALPNAASLAALDEVIASAAVPELLAAQTAIFLRGNSKMPLTARLKPVFRECSFALAPPQDIAASPHWAEIATVLGDRNLRRHFTAKLDTRMLDWLCADLAQSGPVLRVCRPGIMALHLNLSLTTLTTPEFARFARMAREAHASLGIEIALLEAADDPRLFTYAHDILRVNGIRLALDGIDAAALALIEPLGFGADLLKIRFSPSLMEARGAVLARLTHIIDTSGPENILLTGVETDIALIWGQAHGLRQYQGGFLDAVQAASRMAICDAAQFCTLRQCRARAERLTQTGRAGCGNPGLLDIMPDNTAATA
jgi:hypothetical protein